MYINFPAKNMLAGITLRCDLSIASWNAVSESLVVNVFAIVPVSLSIVG